MVADSTGSSDPYCEVYVWCTDMPVCEHKWRTSTRLKTLNPQWGEEATMLLPHAGTAAPLLLHVIVFDCARCPL